MIRFFLPMLVAVLLQGCTSFYPWSSGQPEKVKFDLSRLNSAGLRGPEGGLTSVSYEFCIPDNIDHVDKVMAIDPTLVVYKRSSGRVECSENEYLTVGHTGQNNFREVLKKLAELKYIKSIQEAMFE